MCQIFQLCIYTSVRVANDILITKIYTTRLVLVYRVSYTCDSCIALKYLDTGGKPMTE